MEQLKIIVFDLDDTLYKEVDYVRSGYRAVAEHVREHYHFDGAEQILWQAFASKANPFDALTLEMKPAELDIKQLVEIYRTHRPTISLSRTVELTLEELEGEDIRLCMVTDGRSITQRNKIAALQLERFIPTDKIIISEELGAEKTSATPWRKVMEWYGDDCQYYYVGDNTAKDFYWPNRLGWHTVCIEDDGRNIHPQKFTGDRTHLPQTVLEHIYDLTGLLFG